MQTSTLPTPYALAAARVAARRASTLATFAPGQRVVSAERADERQPRQLGTVVCEAGEQRPGGSPIFWIQFDGDRQQRLRFAWELTAAVDSQPAHEVAP